MKIFALSLLGFAFVTSAHANTIGPGSCASCLGSSYTLSYTPVSGNTIDVYLTVNTTGFTGPATDALNSVALKITSSASDLVGTPILITPPTPSIFTTTVDTGLNANGCAGGVDGFFCSQASTNGLAVGGAGDTYTFEWAVTVDNLANLLTGTQAASVKALYNDSTGKQNGITSEDITLTRTTGVTPEPSSLALLGTGALGIAGILRRRTRT